MILKKIHFAIDKTIKADASQKILLKRYRKLLAKSIKRHSCYWWRWFYA